MQLFGKNIDFQDMINRGLVNLIRTEKDLIQARSFDVVQLGNGSFYFVIKNAKTTKDFVKAMI